jgi:hypothetical protein
MVGAACTADVAQPVRQGPAGATGVAPWRRIMASHPGGALRCDEGVGRTQTWYDVPNGNPSRDLGGLFPG